MENLIEKTILNRKFMLAVAISFVTFLFIASIYFTVNSMNVLDKKTISNQPTLAIDK